ncbi:clavesin-1-like isoform X3 [Diabrotica virgifera virgifera]|nr:clavesin-1-like isoform X3 [Diabrotica virgifera virgifera]
MSEVDVQSELDLGEPPQELLDWALENLNENPETREQVLQDFRDMIFERGECIPHRTDDAFLLRFLRARQFVIGRAHRLFVNYYDFKENNPEFFKDVSLKHMLKMGDDSIITVPPYREQNGRRILLYRWGNWDPAKFSSDEIFAATMLVLELAILEQRAQILGGIGMWDLGGLSLKQAWHMTPSVASKVVQVMVTSFPMKIEALHIVNQSWVFDMCYNIFKPFLDDKMKERIFFHGEDMESLHRHIDPKHLPERYGGIHPDYNYNDWIEGFLSNDQIKKELTSLGYKYKDDDESDSEVESKDKLENDEQ